MPEPAQKRRLADALKAMAANKIIPNASPLISQRADAALAELRKTVLADIPAFSDSGNPDVLPELGDHAADHIREVSRLCDGTLLGDFEFVRNHARRRAEQKFPLEATLHAYRCGHKVVSRWLRDAALTTLNENADVQKVVASIADFSIEYTDTISTIATSEYVNQTRQLAEAEGDRRTELLSVLLSGYDESDGRVAKLLRRAGFLDRRQSFCVAVAQPVDAKEMENPARARRLVEALGEIALHLPIRNLIGIRDDKVVVIFSDTRRVSGWTAAQSALAGRIRPQLLKVGNAILIGMSPDVPSTSHIPRAFVEATLALDFADVRQRVMQYSELPIRRLLIHLADDRVHSALPPWSDEFYLADEKARGSLTATLQAYADANMNLLQAAKRLNVHPNTIYARVQKITDITGMNALNYHALSELLLAADCRPHY